MSDQPYSIDFASLRSQASDMLDSDPAPTPDPVVADTSVAETTEPAIAATPAVDAPDPVVTPLGELDPDVDGDRLVKVKIDGQVVVKPLKEVAGSFLRTSDYTRKTQQLAQQRQELAQQAATQAQYQQQVQQFEQERNQIRHLLSNPQALLNFAQAQNPQLFQPQTPQGDPNEIATVAQVRELAQQQVSREIQKLQQTLAEMESRADQKVLQTRQEIESRQQTAVFAEQINTTVKGLFDQNPILRAVPRAEEVIRYEVSQMQPQTLDEANNAFKTVVQGMVEQLNEHITSQQKTQVVAKAKLSTPRIEPPGGSGPQIQPTTSFAKDGGRNLDWKKLSAAAAELMP